MSYVHATEGVDLVGWQFGPYRVETLLGRGGMGEVYRAYDASQDRIIALKLLAKQYATDDEYQERFRRESRAAARLRDPHVIPIHRYGEIDGRLFIDMRFVEGDSLASVLACHGSMSPLRTALIVEQIASALDAAHADGLIHRDVKPSNVLLTRVPSTSNNDFVYLVDFGISRKLTSSQSTPLTEAGAMVGTPEYMSPEQFVDGLVGPQADVYALACVAYECLTARPPFPKADLPALMYAHVNTLPPRPSSVCPEIPDSVDEVIAVGMAKDLTVRYSSAGEFATALRTALVPGTAGTPFPPTPAAKLDPPTAPPSPPRPLVPFWRHGQSVVLTVAIVVLLIGIGMILGTAVRGPTSKVASSILGILPQPAGAPQPVVPKLTVAATTNVGSKPEAVVVTPDGKDAYVTNIDSKDISVIDTRTNTITATIPVPVGPPQYIAIAPDGRHAYVTIYDPQLGIHSVAVIDTAAKNITATVPVGRRPYGVSVTPDGSQVYVADHDSATISVISTIANTVVATIGVAPNPHWVAFSPDGHTAYVANHESNAMSVIDTDTRTVTSVVPTRESPHSVAVSPNGSQIVVADYNANAVTVIDAARRTVIATVPVGTNPRWVGYSPDGRSAYAINEGSGTLLAIDTAANRITDDIAVGRGPTVGAISADGHHLYVVNQQSNTLSILQVAP